MRRRVVAASFAACVGACATDFGLPGKYLACDADDGCANGYRCAVLDIGPTCLTLAEWEDRCDASEVCNGRDDDCDGFVDEYVANFGGSCIVGVGACAVTGVTICAKDGGTTCGAVSNEPTDEACNGRDDDCDGEVDEGLLDCCVPDTRISCSADEGACMIGEQRCGDDFRWGPCSGALPEPDRCDGIDNDCDGTTDEDFSDLGQPCTEGVGACRADGVRVCASDGRGTTCGVRAATPSVDLCDGLDNDCDGVPDGPWVAELGQPCMDGVGACEQVGMTVCASDGYGTTCAVLPQFGSVEACDGEDNDCDDEVDEGLLDCCVPDTRISCSADEGACMIGEQRCSGDFRWGPCSGVLPEPDLCDGEDNDCDGATDETFTDLGEACSVGQGPCQRDGSRVCQTGGYGTECSVVPALGLVEVCDGTDNDCDGDTDESFVGLTEVCTVGQGACAASGIRVCTDDGDGTRCSVSPGVPSPERCDGATDENCDGYTDEPWDDTLGLACSEGIGACQRDGLWVCAADGRGVTCDAEPGVPARDHEEACDGRDEDCDGETDEGLLDCCVPGMRTSCSTDEGTCTIGEQRCGSDRMWGACLALDGSLAVLPQPDLCDGFDNDCDGDTDESFAGLTESCTVGQGACAASGIRVCTNDGDGTRCSVSPGVPSPERCDGATDEDCDGYTDEPWDDTLDLGCSEGVGACERRGVWVCAADGNGVECDAEPGNPSDEICDGLDNDCGGGVDDSVDSVGCYFGPIGTEGVGPCHGGMTACEDGDTICPGEVTPTVEVCNNVDDDCDSVTDGLRDPDGNPAALTAPCYTGPDDTLGIGVCDAGTATCAAGVWGPCTDDVLPARDACDGLDNDCDGDTDESVTAWSDGFESGDLREWTRSEGNEPRIVSNPVRTGAAAVRLSAEHSVLRGAEDTSYLIRTFDMCMRDVRMSATVHIIGWTDGRCVEFNASLLWEDAGGKVGISGPSAGYYIERRMGAPTMFFTMTPPLATGTWYDIELIRTGGTVEFLLDGASYAVVEGETGEATGVRLGVIAACVDGAFIEVVVDDITIDPL